MTQYVYTMHRVGKMVPPKRQILKDISLSFLPGAKIGILGLNGAGKSTVLRIMAGIDTEIDGDAIPMPNLSIGYLPQEPKLDPDKTVRETVEEALTEQMAARKRLDEVYAAYGDPDADFEKLAEEQAKLEAILFAQGDDLEQQLEIAADALRLPPWDAKIGPLSGGEKRRVALCRLLLSKPDMLLLDEPTNHLDAESVEWLEQYLQRFPGTVVAVTHDRYFLDNAAEWILELDRGRGIPWKGNYSSWLDQKRQRLAQEEREESARQKALKRELEWVRPAPEGPAEQEQEPPGALRGALQLRVPAPQRDARDLHPGRRAAGRPGDRVQGRAQGLRRPAADGRRQLPHPARRDRRHHRPQRRRQVDAVPHDRGQGAARRGRDRHRPEREAGGGRPGARVARRHEDRVRRHQRRARPAQVGRFEMPSRAYLGRFNFKGADQQKPVGELSGGERGRLHLAKTLLEGGNVLLLDEPSNDLDVETLRALEDALGEFAGTVLVISHDRWFLNRIATHIIAFEGDSQVAFFEGNYEEYEADKRQRLGEEAAKPHRIRYRPLTIG